MLFCLEVSFYKHIGNIYVRTMAFHHKELININLIQKLVLCSLFVHYLKKYSQFFDKPFLDIMLNTLAGLSIGIYLTHYYLLEVLIKIGKIFRGKIDGNLIFLLILASMM